MRKGANKMKVVMYKAIARTGNKSINQLREESEQEGIWSSDEELEIMKKAYDLVDGVEIVVVPRLDGKEDRFTLSGWPPESSPKMKEFIYQLEQDEMFGLFQDEREAFDKVWDAGDYEPQGQLSFHVSELEIVEQL